MRNLIRILLLSLSPFFLLSQTIEIEGSLKVMVMDTVNTEDQIVVIGSDGTIATRLASTLIDNTSTGRTLDSDLLLMSYLCEHPILPADTTALFLDNGYSAEDLLSFGVSLGDVINGGASVQELLAAGVTPLSLVNQGISQDSLYGKFYQGGLIFYYASDGTGLISSLTDTGNAEWGCSGTSIPQAAFPYIGYGAINTIDIVAACSTPNIAAALCSNLSQGGYDDWFLPTYYELLEMYNVIGQGASAPNTNIGNFSNASYWSSSHWDSTLGYGWNFGSNFQLFTSKTNVHQVRAARAF